MIEGLLVSGAVAPLALLVLVDVALLASTTQLRSRLPVAAAAAAGGEPSGADGGVGAGGGPTRGRPFPSGAMTGVRRRSRS